MSALRLIRGGQDGGQVGSDPGLPQRASGGEAERTDGGRLRELYDRHAASVLGRCRYLLRDDEAAKDATQEVFAKALKALAEFEGKSSPHTWLMQIATHHCLNELRSRKARWKQDLIELSKDRVQETVNVDTRELIRVLLLAAEPEAQEVAVLTYVDELTQAEIAEQLGRSLPTVRKRLREFLSAARSALAEALPELTLPELEELP
ncbi:MAG: sigma-70 family RNA polymerase sigma factor [Deltaproteobacteria bacterium]|nr:sigma-70 family RNA polymerase sigma factor [Deltaproteobacteria bacterium]